MKKAGSLFAVIAIVVFFVYALRAGTDTIPQGAGMDSTDTVVEGAGMDGTDTVVEGVGRDGTDTAAEGAVVDGQDTAAEDEPAITLNTPAQQGRYCYDALSVEEQLWYQDMYAVLSGMYKEVPLSAAANESVGEQGIDKIFQCVMNDHPELFYVNGYTYTHYTFGEETTRISFSGTYTMDEAERNRRQALIDAAVTECLSGISMEASDYEKVKYVYEYLIAHTEYNKEAPDNQNICSVFIDNQSVCQGYAKATQYLLEKLDIKAALVIGSVYEIESHAWNLVLIDGKYYYVDTTWGDASYQGNAAGKDVQTALPAINYDYLCVTTEQLLKSHRIDNVVPLPRCESMDANYYVMEGAYFTSYEEEMLAAFFEKGYREGKTDVTLRCADEAVYDIFLKELIAEQKIFRYLDTPGGVIAYAEDADRLSLTFWLVNE